MQSLMSRAAQAQSSCHCRLCLHSTTTAATVARRSTTAAARRRRLSVADVFTACYTTILGTAAVIDSQRKDARRREIDKQIEQAKASLHTSPVQDQDPPTDQHPGTDMAYVQATKVPARYVLDKWRREERGMLLLELSHLCGVTRRPLNYTPWTRNQMDWVRIEADMAAEELDLDYVIREPKSELQLQRTATTIVTLVDELMYRCSINPSVRSQDRFENNDKGRGIAEAAVKDFENLRWNPHWPSYGQPSEQPEHAARIRSLLTESIRRIFNQANSTKEIVGNVCYNLLASSYPPNIHTYNLLIVGFNRIQRPDLAQAVIDSYIHHTTWPATQMTVVALLNHYRFTDNLNGLRDTVQRMRGARDDGLHFHIRTKTPHMTWGDRPKEYYALRTYTYVLRAHRSNSVFDSMVTSWLHYGQIGNATMIFVACLRNGGHIHYRTFQKLLRACLNTVDHAAARKLVRGMVKNLGNFAVMIHHIVREGSTATSRVILNSLSHLAGISWLPYDFIPQTPFVYTFSKGTQRLRALIFTTQVQLEVVETAELCIYTIKKLTNSPLSNRLDRVLNFLHMAQGPRQKTLKAMVGFKRLARLLALETRYRELEARMKVITSRAKASILTVKTGYDFDPSNLLELGLSPESRVQRARYKALWNALQKIEVWPGPMTRQDIRAQLLQNLPDADVAQKLENSGRAENLAIRSLIAFYRPHCFAARPYRNHSHHGTIWQLEQEIDAVEDTIRAILFAPLFSEKQKLLMFSVSEVAYDAHRGGCQISPAKRPLLKVDQSTPVGVDKKANLQGIGCFHIPPPREL